jgi:hypothetical protein
VVKLTAVSKERWRATAAERRRWGGRAVTEFYVTRSDTGETRLAVGYGPTPGQRQSFAKVRAALVWGLGEHEVANGKALFASARKIGH